MGLTSLHSSGFGVVLPSGQTYAVLLQAEARRRARVMSKKEMRVIVIRCCCVGVFCCFMVTHAGSCFFWERQAGFSALFLFFRCECCKGDCSQVVFEVFFGVSHANHAGDEEDGEEEEEGEGDGCSFVGFPYARPEGDYDEADDAGKHEFVAEWNNFSH